MARVVEGSVLAILLALELEDVGMLFFVSVRRVSHLSLTRTCMKMVIRVNGRRTNHQRLGDRQKSSPCSHSRSATTESEV